MTTRADAEAYVQTVRGKIRESFGPYPEKTPLNARVTKVVERDAYKIENVLFESRPGFLVSANLYIPKGRSFPLPGVVASCGHSANGKAIDTYQAFCQGLARLGYVVLIFDPIGQGERQQYVDANWKPMRGTGTGEHNYAGIQQVLVDEHFCMWRAWDGIRALDYLMSRKEVDVRHLGITGNSGGGTMTTWLCGVEQRWTMAAPSCFVTEFRRNMENELGADAEQCPPKVLALGLDHEDFLAALAPKPIIILAKEKDYFDARGNEAAYHRLKRLYRLLGAEDNHRLLRGTDLPRLLPGEPGSHVPLVQPLHGNLGRQDGTETGHGEGRDVVVHTARAGGRAAIQADLQLHAGEVAVAGGETSRSGRRGAATEPLPKRFGCRSGPAFRNSAS